MTVLTDMAVALARDFPECPEREAAIGAIMRLDEVDARERSALSVGAQLGGFSGAFRQLMIDEALGGPTVAEVEAASKAEEARRAAELTDPAAELERRVPEPVLSEGAER